MMTTELIPIINRNILEYHFKSTSVRFTSTHSRRKNVLFFCRKLTSPSQHWRLLQRVKSAGCWLLAGEDPSRSPAQSRCVSEEECKSVKNELKRKTSLNQFSCLILFFTLKSALIMTLSNRFQILEHINRHLIGKSQTVKLIVKLFEEKNGEQVE